MSKIKMLHEKDPKQVILNEVGDALKDLVVLNTQVLVAVYVRPEKTYGGIVLPGEHRDEDKYQGKVGMILKKGPTAFVEGPDGKWFGKEKFDELQWVIFRPSDGWPIEVNGVLCRMFDDVSVKMKTRNPDKVR